MRRWFHRSSLVLVTAVLVGLLASSCGGTASTTPPGLSPATSATADTSVPTDMPPGTAVPSPTPIPPISQEPFAYGFNVAWTGDASAESFNARTIQMVQEGGFGWVRIQIEWAQVERAKNDWHPLPIDNLVQAYDGSGVRILASVVNAPEWALDPTGGQLLRDYADWEGFMHFLAERYRGRIQAWEIWNEQNLAREMHGRVRVEDYCRLLEGGYRGVKLADPDAIVVFGGLTPTGVNDPAIAIDDTRYLKDFYAFRDGYYTDFFDVMGMHVNATNNAPDLMWPENPGTGPWSDDPSFYFRRAEQLHDVMTSFGDARPVWITEFGWTTANSAPGYEYGADNTEQDQADYLVRAFEIARTEWPWVTGMFVWNLNYAVIASPDDEVAPWSVLNADWSPRPAFEALRAMPKT